jgi:hypothetical protein
MNPFPPPPIGGLGNIHVAAKKFSEVFEMTPEEVRNSTYLLVVELNTRMLEVEKKLEKLDDVPRRPEHENLWRMVAGVGLMAGFALLGVVFLLARV